MSDSIKETLISGKTIKSTMFTILSLGEIGEKILHTSGFDVIETEKWYRQIIVVAWHKRHIVR